jgi:arylsulfatase A-like enzyme
VDAVLAWLDQDDGRPFFLFVLAIDPHDPYRPPAPYDRMYDADYAGTFDGKLEAPKSAAFAARMTPRDRQYMRALYDGEVSFTDEQFGRLLRELDRRGLARETALVLTSDHGEEFFDHGGWGHGVTLFEEMVHVPLVVRPPGGGPARVAEELVELRDLFALVLSWAGLDADPKLGVRDPAPCLVGRCRTREHAVAVLDLDGYFTETIQDARYKLRWYPRRQSLVLHDLEADPRELGDAARERPDVVADFGRRLDALRRDAERLAPPPPPDAPVTHHMDPQVERALRALGYLH